MPKTRKIAVITCYPDPDYVRARALRQALQTFPNLEVLVIKNKSRGIKRYLEVLMGIIKTRITERPDVYLLTFRGYELVPLLQLLAWPKPIIFDEFINLYEWVVEEHHKVGQGSLPAKLLNGWWGFVLRRCRVVLTDTQAHADHSAIVSHVPASKYVSVPVGTDETLFTPKALGARKKKQFTVFYYSNMLPLHGIDYVLRAAELLKDKPEIVFNVVGGKGTLAEKVAEAQRNGARIDYEGWVPFAELPDRMRSAGVCLAGPFGNTTQSQFVVTGKAYQSLACGALTLIGASEASGVFKDKVNSLVVPQGSAEELAGALTWAYEHQDRLAVIARKGRQLYEQEFSSVAIAKRLQPVLQKVLWD